MNLRPSDPEAYEIPRPHRQGRIPDVRLEVVRGRARQKVRLMTSNAFLIGATHDSDLVLGDPQFPASHSYLLRNHRRVLLRYLGEGPEITVNGRPVVQSTLADGDRIRTGPYEFQVQIDWPATPPLQLHAAESTTAR